MGLRTHIDLDEIGRAASVTGPDGFSDHYRYGPQGEILSIQRERDGRPIDGVAFRHDPLGHIVETLAEVDGKPVPRTRQEFDIADRLLWQADALGILRRASYDSEDHLQQSSVIGAGLQQQERYAYDSKGRLRRVSDNTGAVRELVRDNAGRLIAAIDPLGRWTRYEREDQSLRVTQAANTARPRIVCYALDWQGRLRSVKADAAGGDIAYYRAINDFGQEVAVSGPAGSETRRFRRGGPARPGASGRWHDRRPRL